MTAKINSILDLSCLNLYILLKRQINDEIQATYTKNLMIIYCNTNFEVLSKGCHTIRMKTFSYPLHLEIIMLSLVPTFVLSHSPQLPNNPPNEQKYSGVYGDN